MTILLLACKIKILVLTLWSAKLLLLVKQKETKKKFNKPNNEQVCKIFYQGFSLMNTHTHTSSHIQPHTHTHSDSSKAIHTNQ